MKDQLVSFETVKLAKTKGIDFRDKVFSQFTYSGKAGTYHAYISQSLLQKWLREVHNINILLTVHQINSSKTTYDYCLHKPYGSQSTVTPWSQERYKSYEESLEGGLQEGLKLINI